uniref:Transposase domain-containing protein n=1 Tax=Anopheles funestus TaxID=62324 RepID=A0A4Y0BCY6_ANOFN
MRTRECTCQCTCVDGLPTSVNEPRIEAAASSDAEPYPFSDESGAIEENADIPLDDVVSDDDDDDDINTEESLEFDFSQRSMEACLQFWALKTNTPHTSINMILRIIREKTSCVVPKDARTLLHTSRVPKEIVAVEGGRFWYNGVANCLNIRFSGNQLGNVTELKLKFFVDGLPLHRSSETTFWPILMSIEDMPHIPPMAVAIFYGSSKPGSVEQILRPLVEELNLLLVQGIRLGVQQTLVRLKVLAFVADSPARSFIKACVSCNAGEGCMKCKVNGRRHPRSRAVTYSGINHPPRTDAEFRQGIYVGHRVGNSPLLDLGCFDIVKDVLVGDKLHLIDLGVTRKLLQGWVYGMRGAIKWSDQTFLRISSFLKSITLPSEVNRKLRGLDDLKYWKGSELSSFLLYASIVVLRGNISAEAYQHFMLYFVAITLLSSNVYKDLWDDASDMLSDFVSNYDEIYGEGFISSNMHNLLHVTEEVKRFGPLNTMSTYPFENALQHMKGMLRNGHRCLEQTVNRYSEFEQLNFPKKTPANETTLKGSGDNVVVTMPDFILKSNNRDGWFLSPEKEVIRFFSADKSSGTIKIIGRKLIDPEEYFDDPVSSGVINICKGKISNLSPNSIEYELSDIKAKMVAIKLDNEGHTMFAPLVHTLID